MNQLLFGLNKYSCTIANEKTGHLHSHDGIYRQLIDTSEILKSKKGKKTLNRLK